MTKIGGKCEERETERVRVLTLSDSFSTHLSNDLPVMKKMTYT